MTEEEIQGIRTQFVVKRNDLIRSIKIHQKPYTPRELKIINYMISKIQPNSLETDVFKLSIEGFMKACNLKWDEDNKWNNIKYMKRVIEDVNARQWWIKDKENPKIEYLVGWIRKVSHDDEIISFRFDEQLYPYLFALAQDKNYTQYQLVNSLFMDGTYSIRLYELLLSYFHANETSKTQRFKIETFSELMDLDGKYTRFSDLAKRVIEPSVNEINEKANNMRLEWRISKKARGNKTVEIEFIMRRLTDNEQSDVMKDQRRIEDYE